MKDEVDLSSHNLAFLIAVIIIFMLPYDIWNDVRLASVFTTLLLLLTHQYSICDPTFVRRTFENDKNKKHKQNPYGEFSSDLPVFHDF